MKRRFLITALAAEVCLNLLCLTATSGCRRRKVVVQQIEEESPRVASVVHTADPRSSSQLISGWHDIEQNSWRWTEGKFSVVLRPPRGSAEKGAVLQLKFALPDAIIGKLKTISVAASILNTNLSPETYTQPGEFVYSREVAPKLLTGESVKVDFSLDKWLPPGTIDQRELGLVVTSVGFEPK